MHNLQNPLFYESNTIEFLGYISCVYQIQAVLLPLIWFISGKNMLYPGRICAYEADKILKDSDFVTPHVI
jgi:hypothetical protein